MGSVPSFFLRLAGGSAWAAEFSVEDGKSDGDDADADHDEADEVDAAVADAGMEDDAGDGGAARFRFIDAEKTNDQRTPSGT
jgi:hypothetical protein